MGWEYLIIFIISLVVCYAMAPKVATPKPSSLSDMNIPTAEPGACVPVIFGTRLISSTNTVWYGDLRYEPIKTESGK